MGEETKKLPLYFTFGKVITYAMYIWVVFGIIVLALRVFLLAFSASTSAAFVRFIYTTSDTFLNPFRGIFPPKPVGQTGYLDVAALFAIIIYALIGWGFKALVDLIQHKSRQYTEQHAENDFTQPEGREPIPTHSEPRSPGAATPHRPIRTM